MLPESIQKKLHRRLIPVVEFTAGVLFYIAMFALVGGGIVFIYRLATG